MPQVKMPDGQVVDMPEQLTPELTTRLKALQAAQQQAKTPEQGLESVPITSGEWAVQSVKDIYEGAKDWLTKPQEPKEITANETLGAIGGGAIGGAAFNVAAPKALETAGKFIPGVAGKIVRGMGEAWGKVPVSERAVRGAGGGAGMGTAQVLSESMGAPKSVQLATELVGSGVGEGTASFLTKEVGQMLKVAGMAAYGSPHGAAYAVKGMLDPNKSVNEKMARNLQKQLFGETTAGYTEGLITSEHRAALQESIRATNPNVPRGIPASEYYRNNLFDTVTDSIKQGNLFSDSPEFKKFVGELSVKEQLGQITRRDVDSLMKSLYADRNKNPKVIAGYAENVDNVIREWAASSEKGAVTGAKGIVTNTDMSVRKDLQDALNGYLVSNGHPPLENIYRSTYKAEMLAKSKDEIPYLISKYGTEGQLDKLATNLVKDPQSKLLLIDAIKKHLANADVKDVATEFERLDKLTVKTGMFDLANTADREALKQLQRDSSLITKTANKGEQLAKADRFKRFLVKVIAQKGSVETGTQIGKEKQ